MGKLINLFAILADSAAGATGDATSGVQGTSGGPSASSLGPVIVGLAIACVLELVVIIVLAILWPRKPRR